MLLIKSTPYLLGSQIIHDNIEYLPVFVLVHELIAEHVGRAHNAESSPGFGPVEGANRTVYRKRCAACD